MFSQSKTESGPVKNDLTSAQSNADLTTDLTPSQDQTDSNSVKTELTSSLVTTVYKKTSEGLQTEASMPPIKRVRLSQQEIIRILGEDEETKVMKIFMEFRQ